MEETIEQRVLGLLQDHNFRWQDAYGANNLDMEEKAIPYLIKELKTALTLDPNARLSELRAAEQYAQANYDQLEYGKRDAFIAGSQWRLSLGIRKRISEAILDKNTKEWRKQCKAIDNYTCMCCFKQIPKGSLYYYATGYTATYRNEIGEHVRDRWVWREHLPGQCYTDAQNYESYKKDRLSNL
jgi:hypothetical protein